MKHVSLFWSIAEKWLKQYYIMSIKRGKERREWQGESEIERRRVVRGGRCVLMSIAMCERYMSGGILSTMLLLSCL